MKKDFKVEGVSSLKDYDYYDSSSDTEHYDWEPDLYYFCN